MSDPILPMIQSPDQLQALSMDELKELAVEIRKRIIEVLSVNGGHLASNLGVVELTLALHTVFRSPSDKLIWDVSHQTYVHKLLTGRNDRFEEIRKFKGLCGFSNPKESPHDHFHAGHAGTALSLGLGVAKNRDLSGREEYVIPVIGDATLTCGVSLEAMNNIPRDLKRFIVILNDNRMSISNNVGAITHILSRMISNPTLHRWHQEVEAIVSKIPYGDFISKQGRKVTESLKNLVSPAAYFARYGLSYIGPVDGHDLPKLVEVLKGVQDSSWPVLIHVLTNKGEGMSEAENNPSTYHGAKPFSLCTGKFLPAKNSKPTFPKILGKQLLKMAENDPSLVTVTPAMPLGSCLTELAEKFPERCIDVGIAESHSVTYCGGIAYGKKMKVVIAIYATFLQRALDNLFHDVCLQEIPVVFAIDRSGLSAGDGATHHGVYDISFLNAMPNMVIAQPRNGHVLKELLESAFSYGMPTAIRYPNMATEEIDQPIQKRKLGRAELLEEGEDLLIIALGHMTETALSVKNQLQEKGISAAVLDPVFVKPLDSELICDLLVKHKNIVTIEEHSVICGLGSILNHFFLSRGYNDLNVLNLGIPETYVEQGSYGELMEELGLTSEKVAEQIIKTFSFGKSPEKVNI